MDQNSEDLAWYRYQLSFSFSVCCPAQLSPVHPSSKLGCVWLASAEQPVVRGTAATASPAVTTRLGVRARSESLRLTGITTLVVLHGTPASQP